MDGARQSEQRDALGPNVFLRGPRIQRGGPRSFGTGKPSEPSEPSLFPSPYSLYHVWPWEYPSERQPLTITCPAFPRPYCGTRASLFFFRSLCNAGIARAFLFHLIYFDSVDLFFSYSFYCVKTRRNDVAYSRCRLLPYRRARWRSQEKKRGLCNCVQTQCQFRLHRSAIVVH